VPQLHGVPGAVWIHNGRPLVVFGSRSKAARGQMKIELLA
jgi:hypothetical protein